MNVLTVLAWTVLAGCFAGFLLALHVGESCATSTGPYLAGGMFVAWMWLTYQQDRRDR